MSKKREPLAVVINYFTTTEVDVANHALTVVKEIVRSRQPQPVRGERNHRKKPAAARRGPADRPLPLEGNAAN